MQGLKAIKCFVTRTYSDTGQTKLFCEWDDSSRTEGSPFSTHMQALKARAVRAGKPVTTEVR